MSTEPNASKKRNIDTLLQENSLLSLLINQPTQRTSPISTSSTRLNNLLKDESFGSRKQNGFLSGKIYEIYGSINSCKNHLLFDIINNTISHQKCLYINSEHQLFEKFFKSQENLDIIKVSNNSSSMIHKIFNNLLDEKNSSYRLIIINDLPRILFNEFENFNKILIENNKKISLINAKINERRTYGDDYKLNKLEKVLKFNKKRKVLSDEDLGKNEIINNLILLFLDYMRFNKNCTIVISGNLIGKSVVESLVKNAITKIEQEEEEEEVNIFEKILDDFSDDGEDAQNTFGIREDDNEAMINELNNVGDEELICNDDEEIYGGEDDEVGYISEEDNNIGNEEDDVEEENEEPIIEEEVEEEEGHDSTIYRNIGTVYNIDYGIVTSERIAHDPFGNSIMNQKLNNHSGMITPENSDNDIAAANKKNQVPLSQSSFIEANKPSKSKNVSKTLTVLKRTELKNYRKNKLVSYLGNNPVWSEFIEARIILLKDWYQRPDYNLLLKCIRSSNLEQSIENDKRLNDLRFFEMDWAYVDKKSSKLENQNDRNFIDVNEICDQDEIESQTIRRVCCFLTGELWEVIDFPEEECKDTATLESCLKEIDEELSFPEEKDNKDWMSQNEIDLQIFYKNNTTQKPNDQYTSPVVVRPNITNYHHNNTTGTISYSFNNSTSNEESLIKVSNHNLLQSDSEDDQSPKKNKSQMLFFTQAETQEQEQELIDEIPNSQEDDEEVVLQRQEYLTIIDRFHKKYGDDSDQLQNRLVRLKQKLSKINHVENYNA